MSEYFEFAAIDRLLADGEMAALRAVSTRAAITPSGFVNHYEWGGLKADPLDWMRRYFDAFVYWGNFDNGMMRAASVTPSQEIQMSSPLSRTVSPRLAIFAACALVFTMQGAALAADAVSTKPLAIKTKKSPLLTREELRACMAAQTKLHEQREELTKLQGQLTTEKEDIVRTGNELKDQLAALDRTNREAIVAYTEANAAREKRIDAFELSSTAYNDKVQANETADAAYKKDCENRRFDEKDETAIKKGK